MLLISSRSSVQEAPWPPYWLCIVFTAAGKLLCILRKSCVFNRCSPSGLSLSLICALIGMIGFPRQPYKESEFARVMVYTYSLCRVVFSSPPHIAKPNYVRLTAAARGDDDLPGGWYSIRIHLTMKVRLCFWQSWATGLVVVVKTKYFFLD